MPVGTRPMPAPTTVQSQSVLLLLGSRRRCAWQPRTHHMLGIGHLSSHVPLVQTRSSILHHHADLQLPLGPRVAIAGRINTRVFSHNSHNSSSSSSSEVSYPSSPEPSAGATAAEARQPPAGHADASAGAVNDRVAEHAAGQESHSHTHSEQHGAQAHGTHGAPGHGDHHGHGHSHSHGHGAAHQLQHRATEKMTFQFLEKVHAALQCNRKGFYSVC